MVLFSPDQFELTVHTVTLQMPPSTPLILLSVFDLLNDAVSTA